MPTDDLDHPPRYRIEHRPPGEYPAVLALASRIGEAAAAFEDHIRHLAAAGERGTLALVCEHRGCDLPMLARPISPGLLL
jgi:hypothetical protein